MPAPHLRTLSQQLREIYGKPVRKVAIDAGFTCPNRDGTRGYGGCTFCNNDSFVHPAPGAPNARQPVAHEAGRGHRSSCDAVPARARPAGTPGPAASPGRDRGFPVTAAELDARVEWVRRQVAEGCERLGRGRRAGGGAIAYFQAYTNTYGPVTALRRLYDAALEHPAVCGLAVGTRPDSVPDEVLDLLEEYAAARPVWVELGVESSHDATLRAIHRGHLWEEFVDAAGRIGGRGLHLCVHLILGLPGETREMVQETAERLASVFDSIQAPSKGVKLHHLQIVRGTALEAAYRGGEVALLGPGEYVELACDVLERLPSGTVVHRLSADSPHAVLIGPRWNLSKHEIREAIGAELRSAARITGPERGRDHPPGEDAIETRFRPDAFAP